MSDGLGGEIFHPRTRIGLDAVIHTVGGQAHPSQRRLANTRREEQQYAAYTAAGRGRPAGAKSERAAATALGSQRRSSMCAQRRSSPAGSGR